ncbi:hypothetical protein DLJ53_09250 [Acuticoccus sediminis]|uniref:Uncharacterized protein n=1 Tax=Acuticoccus sediminis TaxID=2184697 RepID=A0A8B2NSV1_9HYPH|nr:hypothetical protein [Acuticoccus sediminis]RAI01599.1 hypothetical protein DLJ53_09250 [Acuticoccus sediminis]
MPEFPEIAEAAASGAVAATYADIKATSGLAMVNLIYRHMATIPGALEWGWATIRDSIRYPRIEGARAGLSVPAFGAPLPAEAYVSVGLREEAVRSALAVVGSYNTANALNLVTLTALLRLIDVAAGEAAAERGPAATRPGASDPIPPIVAMDAMDEPTRHMVLALTRMGDVGPADSGIVPSLYRHLAHWPPYLGLVLAVLVPLDSSGLLKRAREELVEEARRMAEPLVDEALARGVASLPVAARAPLRSALETFTGYTIANMLPIGNTLMALGPPDWRPAAHQG